MIKATLVVVAVAFLAYFAVGAAFSGTQMVNKRAAVIEAAAQ
jgi:hypothetical protein